MPPSPSKRKEAPAEPLKRALGTAVRAIAAKSDIEVTFAAGQPELAGNLVTLPEPSRVPGKKEIAVIRGHADSLALTASCHNPKLHAKLAPPAGPARAVFEAVERARVEAIGSNRMPGMASNITAKVEDHFSHGRYRDVKDRSEAPLEEALALIVRERLTGQKAPENAKGLVDTWRPWVEEKAGKTLARLDELSESQAKFGRALRDVLKSLELAEELSENSEKNDEERSEDEEQGEATAPKTARTLRRASPRTATNLRPRARMARTRTARRTARPSRWSSTPTARRIPIPVSPGARTAPCWMTPRPSATRSFPSSTTRKSRPRNCRRRTNWSACARSSTRS